MHGDQRYVPVNDLFAGIELCTITMEEAGKAAKILFKKFGKKSLGGPSMLYDVKTYRTRKCWASTKPNAGLRHGWRRLAHDVSHIIFRARHPKFRPHAGGHSRLEREIVQFMIEKGWPTGTLKTPVKSRPTVSDKLSRIDQKIEKWTRKLNRAENALKKLNRKKKYMEQKNKESQSVTTGNT